MSRRAFLLSLWTLIAFLDELECSPSRTSNSLGEEDDESVEKGFRLPGTLFLNTEEKLQIDQENALHTLDFLKNRGSKEGSQGIQAQASQKGLGHDQDDDISDADIPQKRVLRRRKGPTLSVVNPLEILRQRLMLDLARRRIHENQQQIVANANFLENLGKRNAPDGLWPRQRGGSLGDEDDGKTSTYLR